MNAELTISDGKKFNKTIKLKPGKYLIGWAPECEIRFSTKFTDISRIHARIDFTSSGELKLIDLDSKTGTMVNGSVIRKRKLDTDDVISIAHYTFRVRCPEVEVKGKPVIEMEDEDEDAKVETLAEDLAKIKESTRMILKEVSKRIYGQKQVLKFIWATILAKGHCLLIGVPGLAKTYTVTTFSDALGLNFDRIQFTPDLMPSDIVGSNILQVDDDGRRSFEFVQGPIFTQLLLADEINRTPPKTQAALLEAMQEYQVTVGNRTLRLPSPFHVIASQNPIEQEGTYPLPEAQQDRFMICLVLDYPQRDHEIDILLRTTEGKTPEVKKVLNFEDILHFQSVTNQIVLSRESAEYAADLVRATRPAEDDVPDYIKSYVDWGAGPRAGQSLIRVAKALAAIDGRPALSTDDIKEIAVPVLRHRISCNYKARAEGLDEVKIIEKLLSETTLSQQAG